MVRHPLMSLIGPSRRPIVCASSTRFSGFTIILVVFRITITPQFGQRSQETLHRRPHSVFLERSCACFMSSIGTDRCGTKKHLASHHLQDKEWFIVFSLKCLFLIG